MVAVKGSKQRHLKIIEYRPYRRIWGWGITALLFAGGLQGAFWYGHKQGMAGQERAILDLSAIRIELESARSAEAELRQSLANIKLGGEVDRKSLEEVRLEVLDLKSNIAVLEEENQFYRNLMAPSENAQGLNFGTVEVADTERSRNYRFKIVMQQLATNHELLVGTLNVNIVGRRNGEVTVLSLSDISKDVDNPNIKLRFKYFQNIEGELVLPQGFEPERIELDARSTGKNATTVDKRFGWLVRERD